MIVVNGVQQDSNFKFSNPVFAKFIKQSLNSAQNPKLFKSLLPNVIYRGFPSGFSTVFHRL